MDDRVRPSRQSPEGGFTYGRPAGHTAQDRTMCVIDLITGALGAGAGPEQGRIRAVTGPESDAPGGLAVVMLMGFQQRAH